MAAKAFAVFVNLQLLLLLTGLVAAGAIICTETFIGAHAFVVRSSALIYDACVCVGGGGGGWRCVLYT